MDAFDLLRIRNRWKRRANELEAKAATLPNGDPYRAQVLAGREMLLACEKELEEYFESHVIDVEAVPVSSRRQQGTGTGR